MSQHGADCNVETDADTTLKIPASFAAYEDAAPEPASETRSRPSGVKSNPNGTLPCDGFEIAELSDPSALTRYVSMVFDVRSATASKEPSRLKRTTAAPPATALN